MKINNRILIVDDNEAIHDDFRKVLTYSKPNKLDQILSDVEASIFEDAKPVGEMPAIQYELDFAFQGKEALEKIGRAEEEGRPYAVVFTDVRMPPGLDGVQLVQRIWKRHPHTEIVIVTAFSDYSWEDLFERVGWTEHLLFLRKPFDSMTVKQIALTLTKKWSIDNQTRIRMREMEYSYHRRNEKLNEIVREIKDLEELDEDDAGMI